MAISKEQLSAIISGRAKDLCNPNFDKMVESKKSHNNGAHPSTSDYDYDADKYDKMYLSEDEEFTLPVNNITYNQHTASKSKMPEFIKNSMLNEQIDTSSLSVGTSVLDGMNTHPQKQSNKKTIAEQRVSSSQSSVDYSIIKAIVNECLNEYFSKQPLNESTSLKTIGLKNGHISIVDNKGNVYKAKLEKIGNKNDIE